jgi:hypothetical protein
MRHEHRSNAAMERHEVCPRLIKIEANRAERRGAVFSRVSSGMAYRRGLTDQSRSDIFVRYHA